MVRGGSVKKSYRAADQDVAKGSEDYYLEEQGEAFWAFEEIDFVLARLEMLEASITDEESDQEIEDLEYSDAEKKTLNKPFRLKDGKKKYGVYVKNPKTGNIVMVKFGDPNMEIKRDDPARRRSFRARHKCDTAKDKTTPRYWSCKFWSKKPVSKMVSNEVLAWDEEEVYSEWIWDDEGFAKHQDLLNAYPFLTEIKLVVEEEDI
jgi:hypothetical protein